MLSRNPTRVHHAHLVDLKVQSDCHQLLSGTRLAADQDDENSRL
jgi:hypothetical protein